MTSRPAGVGHVVAEERGTEHVDAEEEPARRSSGSTFGWAVIGDASVAVEVLDAGPFEVGGEGVGEPGLDQGEGRAGVADDVGVGRAVDRFGRAPREVRCPTLAASARVRTHRLRYPVGLAAGERDGVDHAVAA